MPFKDSDEGTTKWYECPVHGASGFKMGWVKKPGKYLPSIKTLSPVCIVCGAEMKVVSE